MREAGERVMIRVRGGKAAAIPWIERGFPGKPLELKIKVEPRTGLLFAHSAVVPAGDFDYVRDVAGVELGKSRTSISAERIRSDLNAEFGSPRFRHGPQALYDQKLSNDPKEKERVVAFTPDGDTTPSRHRCRRARR